MVFQSKHGLTDSQHSTIAGQERLAYNERMKPGSSSAAARPNPLDTELVSAFERQDLPAIRSALERGANPSARKRYRGLVGESVGLLAARNGWVEELSLLLEHAGKCEAETVLGAALFIERAQRSTEHHHHEQAHALFALLEEHQADWGVSDRFIGGGLRAIDLVATAFPAWGAQAAQRQKLVPLALDASPKAARHAA